MEEMDVKALVAAALKERDEAEAKKAAELKAIEDAKAEGAKAAIEELKSKGQLKASQYHTTDKRDDDNDGVAAFKAWMVTGQVNHGLIAPDSTMQNMKAAFNITDGATGGYLVPDPLYNRIIAKRDIASFVRQAPCSRFQTSADHLLIPVEDTSHTDFVETAEAAAYDENEGTIAQKDVALVKYTKEIRATEEFLSDQATNWEEWIMNALGRAEAGLENAVATANLLDGTGATAATAAATISQITAAELARLVGSLGGGYNVAGECGFLMKNSTKWFLYGVTGSDFHFLQTPQGGDFFGYPAYISDDMPAMTTGLYSTLFGNFNYFAVVEKPGMMIQRNPYLYMATGKIGIFASIFRGYDVLVSTAFYKMAQA